MYKIEKGTAADTDELEQLYNELNDHLEATINYPGWIKGIYPVREDAVKGIGCGALFVLRIHSDPLGDRSGLCRYPGHPYLRRTSFIYEARRWFRFASFCRAIRKTGRYESNPSGCLHT